MNNISQNFLIPHRTSQFIKKNLHHTPPHIILLCPHPHHTFMYSMGKQNCALSHTVIICKSFLKYIFPFLEDFFWFFGTFWGDSWCGCGTYFLNFRTSPHHHIEISKISAHAHVRKGTDMCGQVRMCRNVDHYQKSDHVVYEWPLTGEVLFCKGPFKVFAGLQFIKGSLKKESRSQRSFIA